MKFNLYANAENKKELREFITPNDQVYSKKTAINEINNNKDIKLKAYRIEINIVEISK